MFAFFDIGVELAVSEVRAQLNAVAHNGAEEDLACGYGEDGEFLALQLEDVVGGVRIVLEQLNEGVQNFGSGLPEVTLVSAKVDMTGRLQEHGDAVNFEAGEKGETLRIFMTDFPKGD